jgi:hypothetical protein
VSPVKYEMGFYIPEDDIHHSHRRENVKSYNYRVAAQLVTSRVVLSSTELVSQSISNLVEPRF